MPEPVLDDRALAPDFSSFLLALPDAVARAAIGLHISDADSDLLLRRSDWALTYYRQWRGEAVRPDRGAPVALPRADDRQVDPPVAAPPFDGPASDAPATVHARRTPPRFAIAAVAAATVLLAGIAGAGLLQSGATAEPAASSAADPFPPGLAGPGARTSASPGPTGSTDRVQRLDDDLTVALRLDDRTAALPAAGTAVRQELVHVADLACLQGYDDDLAAQIARSVSGRPDLDQRAGDAVALAIARYCGSA